MSHENRHIAEVADGIYRIHTPVDALPGGFSFNQYLVVDDDALLFHTGPRDMAPRVIDAIASVIPLDRLRWVSFGHVEVDECGGLDAILAAARHAAPLCGRIGAMVQNGLAARPARGLADGESVVLGTRSVTWLDAPHVPHGWDNGYLVETTTRTLLCGDLFTQPGTGERALVEDDILGPSEGLREAMDYYAHAPHTRDTLERLAALEPRTLACMHGSAFRGDGGKMLRALAAAVAK